MLPTIISAFFLGQLAALNRRSENVVIKAIIVPELELRNVKWHAFAVYLVERKADNRHP
jgi:hypothetical protein